MNCQLLVNALHEQVTLGPVTAVDCVRTCCMAALTKELCQVPMFFCLHAAGGHLLAWH
jgi:hypothetical protein